MANKVFHVNGISKDGQDQKYSLEVYRDVSMESKYIVNDYKIQKNVNVNAVLGSVKNIFTWIPGERILLPEFGSRLYSLLYEGILPETEERIAAEIRKCMTDWEPRAKIVEIRNISTVEDTEDNTIHLEIVFNIVGLDDKQYSYSFIYKRPNS